jgi:hypothetical protein
MGIVLPSNFYMDSFTTPSSFDLDRISLVDYVVLRSERNARLKRVEPQWYIVDSAPCDAPSLTSGVLYVGTLDFVSRYGRRSLPRAILRPTTRQCSILDQGRGRKGGGTGAPHRGQAPPQVTARARSGPILRCPRSPSLQLTTSPSWRWHRRLPEAGEQTSDRPCQTGRMLSCVSEGQCTDSDPPRGELHPQNWPTRAASGT